MSIVVIDKCAGTICGRAWKKSGGGKSRTTHLQKDHHVLYDAVIEFRQYQTWIQGIPNDDNAAPDDDDVPGTPQKATVNKFEKAREERILQQMQLLLPHEERLCFDSLMGLIFRQGGSFSLVGSQDMRRLCHTLNRNFSFPSTERLQGMMDSKVRSYRIRLKSYLNQHVAYGSITADGWTSRDQRKFVGITYHFMTPEFKMASVVIGMERTYGQQTAESVLETIQSVIRLWDLEGKIIGVTTDQGSNYKKAMSMYEDISKANWIPCASHKIQLCINKALDSTPDAQAVIDRCHKISTFYRGGGFSTDLLVKHQRRLYDKSSKLKSMNATRWNSRYMMAARVLKVSGAIVECHKELESTNHLKGAAGKVTLESLLLTKDHVDTLQEVIDFLGPAADFTHWAGNLASPTISSIYSRVYSMLPPAEIFATKAVRDLHANMSKFIEDAWPLETMPKAMLLAVFLNPAIASDPLFRTKSYCDGQTLFAKSKEIAIEVVSGFLQMEHKAKVERARLEASKEEASRQGEAGDEDQLPCDDALSPGTALDALYTKSYFDVLAKMPVDAYGVLVVGMSKQFEKYRACPQDFWSKYRHHSALGTLGRVARAYLTIQATSTESERLFSKAGLILGDLNTALSDQNLKNIIFLHSFERLESLGIKLH